MNLIVIDCTTPFNHTIATNMRECVGAIYVHILMITGFISTYAISANVATIKGL